MKNIVILISGTGSNMSAIVQAAKNKNWQEKYNAKIAAVISNKPDAKGLDFANSQNIPTAVIDHKQYKTRAEFDSALKEKIEEYSPALVVLAGFMRVLEAEFVNYYKGRLINIHPSLLPAFTGLNTHQRAIDAGCKFTGATVHQVIAELDAGPILEQACVPILQGDTAETLAQKVLTQEHIIYPNAIEKLLGN